MNEEELKEEIANLKAKLNGALDLLENCGYCRECLWDIESINDISTGLKEAVWPEDNTPLCKECNEVFVNTVNDNINYQEELKTLFKNRRKHNENI